MKKTQSGSRGKIKSWLIVFSALPAYPLFIAICYFLIFGTWSAIEKSDFTSFQKTITDHYLYHIIGTLTMLLATLSIVWFYWILIQKNSFVSLGFKFKFVLKESAFGLFTGIIIISSIFLILLLFRKIEINEVSFNFSSLLNYFIAFILVSLNEEILARGYFLGSFLKLANKYFALFISSLLFSLMHILNADFSFIPFINLFLAGILLGLVYIHTKRLWFSLALHFIWNFLQGPVFGSQVSGNNSGDSIFKITTIGNDLTTGGRFGFEGSLIMTGLVIGIIVVLELYYHKNQPIISE